MTKIYLDYAASSPVRPKIKSKILPFLAEKFGNPSSIHFFGRETRKAIDEARGKIAQFFNCETPEIIFTSGGTESDNLAIRGIINNSKIKYQKSKLPHIITTKIEHHAVLYTCEDLKKSGLAEVTYLNVNKNGQINLEDFKKSVKPNTILVSIMYANNETGTIEPIREIGKIIEKENKNRKNRIYFHTDAVQAAPYLDCDTKYLHVDLLSISGHKLGAPKGIGALYIKKNTPFKPIITGGEHEYGKRAGTENVLGIVALGEAVKLARNQKEIKKIKKLRDCLENGIMAKISNIEINGDRQKRLPNITNINFKYVEGESILLNLDLKGIAASSGSACTSGSLELSHVIMAMYNDPLRAHGSIRFSLGWNNTQQEIDYVIKVLPPIIKKLRKISPFGKVGNKVKK